MFKYIVMCASFDGQDKVFCHISTMDASDHERILAAAEALHPGMRYVIISAILTSLCDFTPQDYIWQAPDEEVRQFWPAWH